MTTYNTIAGAFKNGSGDVFFTKDNQFIAVSRKDDNSNFLNLGFTQLTYDEVIETDRLERSLNITPIDSNVIANLQNIKAKSVKSYSNLHNGHDGYYDEFPDAYGQSL